MLTPGLCEQWIYSPVRQVARNRARHTNGPLAPLHGALHVRRSTLRIFFRLLRAQGLFHSDLTADIKLPPRAPREPNPLSEAEVRRIRSTCKRTQAQTLVPATVALTLASATPAEIAEARVGDVYLDARRVWLHSRAGLTWQRWAELDDWAVAALRQRIDWLKSVGKAGAEDFLVYDGKAVDPTAAASTRRTSAVNVNLRRALVLADITDSATMPVAFLDYVAARIYRETGRYEVVAARMGFASLNRAAHAVGLEWRTEHLVTGPEGA